jgi:large subunit ribosomal protein L17
MYKRIKGKKFSRKTDQRRAFMRALAVNLITREKIKTTKVRARQTALLVEKLITKAKKNDLAARKALAKVLPPAAGKKLIVSIAPRFKDRVGGYTRVIKIGPRLHDGAPMAIVELLDRPAADNAAKTEAKQEKKPAKAAAKTKEKKEKRAKANKPEESKS